MGRCSMTQEPSMVLCDNLEGWDEVGGGSKAQAGGDMAGPCRCMSETSTTLNYPPIKNK